MANGKCKCGRLLEKGEKLCPRCNSKKDAKTKRFSYGAAGIALLCVAADMCLNKGQISKGTLNKIKGIFNK